MMHFDDGSGLTNQWIPLFKDHCPLCQTTLYFISDPSTMFGCSQNSTEMVQKNVQRSNGRKQKQPLTVIFSCWPFQQVTHQLVGPDCQVHSPCEAMLIPFINFFMVHTRFSPFLDRRMEMKGCPLPKHRVTPFFLGICPQLL